MHAKLLASGPGRSAVDAASRGRPQSSTVSVTLWLWFGVLATAALPLLGLALTHQRAFENSLLQTMLGNISIIAEKKAKAVEDYMGERIQDANELARRKSVREGLGRYSEAFRRHGTAAPARGPAEDLLATELTEMVDSAGYHDVLLIDARGNVVFSARREAEWGSDLLQGEFSQTALGQAYRRSKERMQTQSTGFQPYAPSGNRHAAFVVAPVLDAGAVLGAVALQLDSHRVAQVATDRTGLVVSGETVLGQRHGDHVTYMSDLPWAQSARGTTVAWADAPFALRQAMEGKQDQGRVKDYADRDCLAAWRYLPSLGWGMTVKIHADEALLPAQRLRSLTYLIFAVFLLVSALAAYLLGWAVSRPLKKLTAAAHRIAGGQLSERASAAPFLGELAVLARTFNSMADSVENAQRSLEATVASRTAELARTNRRLEEDIAVRQQAQEQLRLYGEVFKQGGDAILLTDHANRIVDVNPAFTRLTGYTLDEVRGCNPSILASGRTPPEVYASLWAALVQEGFWVGEVWDKRKDGSIYPKLMSASVVRDANGAIVNYIARFTDITDRKAIEARMEQLAHHDTLTGLLNRFSLQHQLERAIATARASGSKLVLAFLDLDRFKAVNDTLGHAVGDELLLRVAQRIRNCVRDTDLVARLGGDEFVVVLPETDGVAGPARLADKLLEHLSEPYRIQGQRIYSTASLGLALYPDDGSSFEDIMRSADIAMYYAKSQGRNNAQFFTGELNRASLDRMRLERELRVAMEMGQLTLHYQPKLDVRSGAITGVEALLRWPHPDLGFIPPSRFIPVAEEAGLISTLSEWVLHEACTRLGHWKQLGLGRISMAVNLSAHSLQSSSIVEQVTVVLNECQLDPRDLELEVTESVAMSDQERCIEQLRALRELGVKLAIDDFGTGYSSLSYLKLLPVDTLKLDRSFVQDIESNHNDLAICDATIALAHKLGLQVVAEGVETQTQRELLVRHHCDALQGYFICRPLSHERALAFIRQWNDKDGA